MIREHVSSRRAGRRDRKNRESFEALALPHLDSLYRTALRMSRRAEEAEDLVQETYMKAFRSFRTFKPEPTFAPGSSRYSPTATSTATGS